MIDGSPLVESRGLGPKLLRREPDPIDEGVREGGMIVEARADCDLSDARRRAFAQQRTGVEKSASQLYRLGHNPECRANIRRSVRSESPSADASAAIVLG